MSSEDSELGQGQGRGGRWRRDNRRKPAARRYDKIADTLHASLWFRPALWMLVFGALAFGLVALDMWFDARFEPDAVPRLLRSSPDDARALLGAIAGAMLTVVSLAFSVVMIAVVQMANAYSPRLLRLYIGDVYNQHVLGILLGTFLYSLIVLRSERCEAELDRSFPTGIGVDSPGPDAGLLDGDPIMIRAKRSGYVQIFDLEPLAEREREQPLALRMHWRMGDFVLEGTALASAWGPFDSRDRAALDRACVFGTERTMRQDPRFGIEQLTDVALRALSPGINDPTTACAAINALTVLFGKLLTREELVLWRSDTKGKVHVEFSVASFAELIGLSYLRILGYGSRDTQVVRRMIGACVQLHAVAQTDAQRSVLTALLAAIHAEADAGLGITAHRRTLDEDFASACLELAHPRLPALADGRPAWPATGAGAWRVSAVAARRPPPASRRTSGTGSGAG